MKYKIGDKVQLLNFGSWRNSLYGEIIHIGKHTIAIKLNEESKKISNMSSAYVCGRSPDIKLIGVDLTCIEL